jgi:NADPH:quinone reductase-like Zn-dependent oxidoreductase
MLIVIYRSGYTVITTCSPKNFGLVKSLGAAAAFDYKDPKCAEDIKAYTNNNLKFIWDCISLESSAKLCAEVIAPGGTYGMILFLKFPRDDVKQLFSLGYTAVGEAVEKGGTTFSAEKNAKNFDFMVKWMEVAEKLIAEGKIKPHPAKVDQGLEKVLEGVDLLRHDKVSGQKLVYTV